MTCVQTNAIPVPVTAGVEGGRVAYPPPERAMKKILVLLMLAAMLVLGFTCTSMAAEEPVSLAMELSATRFSGPAEVQVTLTVTNHLAEDMPGPVALYYLEGDTGKIIEEFGTPTLKANESRSWTGTWMVTEEQIKAGKVIFAVRYSYLKEDGTVDKKTSSYYLPIEDAGAVAQVEINRYIAPTMAAKGQKVSVTYEIVNTGSIDVTNVVIKEGSAISKTEGKIDLVKAGEKAAHTFTVTMNKKDLTSNASITYHANGKAYTETVGNQVIKYGDVKLNASLTADKKGGTEGDTVKLTLTLKNTGKVDYQDIAVTDPTLGTVFTGLTVEAGKTLVQEKEIAISKSASYQFTVTGTDASGNTVETATDHVSITAVDPAKAISLVVTAEVDKPIVYSLPAVVKFTVSVTNTSDTAAQNVTVSATGVDLYSFESIPAGQTRTFVRDVRVEMAGNFRFDARMANQLGDTETFSSELIRVIHSTPTAAPTQVPIAKPVLPEKEELPTHDGLPPYVDTVQNVLSIAQWIFLGMSAMAVVLIIVGIIGRVKNASHSAKASDHLERNGYRDYTMAVSSKKRHSMPAEEGETEESAAPIEEAPSVQPQEEAADPAAVNDKMAELYPEAVQEEATYARRRKDN